MNWTEGALARHSRRKGWDKDAARQKQYFAKARARKSEAAPKRTLHASSFIPDYIPRSPQVQHQQQTSSPTRTKQATSRKRLFSQRDGRGDAAATALGQRADPPLGKHRLDSDNTEKSPYQQGDSGVNLDAKRRKLLEKNDWTGVSFQKPILVDFSWQGGDARKPVLPDVDSRPAKRQRISELPRKGNDTRGSKKLFDIDDQMNIRIGSQDLRWSRDSNTVRSSTSQDRPLPTFAAWASQQGDSSNTHIRSSSSRSTRHPVQPPSGAESLSGTTSSDSERQGQTTSPANETEHSSLGRFDGRRTKTPDQPRYVVTSSPPIIHHPQPTRGKRLALFDIRSPVPEDVDSVVAQIGAPNHTFDRVTNDDAQWNQWLNARDCSRPRSNPDDREDDEALPSISPGISHYRDGSEHSRLLPSACENADERELPSDSNGSPTCPSAPGPSDTVSPFSVRPGSELLMLSEHRSWRPNERPRTAFPTNQTIRSKHGGDERRTKAGDDLLLPSRDELPKAPNVQDLIDLLEMEEEKGQPEQTGSPEENVVDEDEIWKRFVFDEDCTEINRKARHEAQQQTADDLYRAPSGLPSDGAEPPSTSRDNPSTSPTSIASLAMASSESSSCANGHGSSDIAPTETTDTANSNTAHIGSPKPQHSDFKFHQPSAFVGRLASLPPTNNMRPMQWQSTKRGRGRLRKRRGGGRPEFRAMPDYDDDPIEECCENELVE
ncbi:hypothetical protein QQZ08_001549 [Neonectria magnoliae]|uniref:Uncharacterized protein n=1 Tax=Neonectria magnoliae TaxID=2732573 RepID=A0ABR1IFV8_9HYPO